MSIHIKKTANSKLLNELGITYEKLLAEFGSDEVYVEFDSGTPKTTEDRFLDDNKTVLDLYNFLLNCNTNHEK